MDKTTGLQSRGTGPLAGADGLSLGGSGSPEAAPPQVEVSLIVTTRDRGRFLPPFLDSIEALVVHVSFEIILVDNGSDDDTWDLLSRFAERSKFQVRVVREARPGASCGRNAGIEAARGKILCFTDDDCYPRADLVEAIVGIFRTRDLGFLGGQALLFDPEDDPVCVTTRTTEANFRPCSMLTTGDVQGSCMAFRREVFETVGLFDPAFGAGGPLRGAEDCDLVARAAFAGWAGGYFLEPVTYHHHRRRGEGSAKITFNYDYARGAHLAKLFLKHPKYRRLVLQHWHWNTQIFWRPSRRAFQKFWRELRGACRYLVSYARTDPPALTSAAAWRAP